MATPPLSLNSTQNRAKNPCNLNLWPCHEATVEYVRMSHLSEAAASAAVAVFGDWLIMTAVNADALTCGRLHIKLRQTCTACNEQSATQDVVTYTTQDIGKISSVFYNCIF